MRAEAQIRFDMPEAAHVRLAVYDVMGREVATLADGQMPPGFHHVRLEPSQLPAGTYLYRFTAGSFTDVKSMVLVR